LQGTVHLHFQQRGGTSIDAERGSVNRCTAPSPGELEANECEQHADMLRLTEPRSKSTCFQQSAGPA
jgi:hypothetical protein